MFLAVKILLKTINCNLLNKACPASFALGKLDNETIGISARSLGEIDVSVIIKEMGGGGHSSNAATQIKQKTLKEVKQELINILENRGKSKWQNK